MTAPGTNRDSLFVYIEFKMADTQNNSEEHALLISKSVPRWFNKCGILRYKWTFGYRIWKLKEIDSIIVFEEMADNAKQSGGDKKDNPPNPNNPTKNEQEEKNVQLPPSQFSTQASIGHRLDLE